MSVTGSVIGQSGWSSQLALTKLSCLLIQRARSKVDEPLPEAAGDKSRGITLQQPTPVTWHTSWHSGNGSSLVQV